MRWKWQRQIKISFNETNEIQRNTILMKIRKKVQIGALADDSINYRLLYVSPMNKTYHFMISTSVAFANGKYVLRVYHFDFPSSFLYEKK